MMPKKTSINIDLNPKLNPQLPAPIFIKRGNKKGMNLFSNNQKITQLRGILMISSLLVLGGCFSPVRSSSGTVSAISGAGVQLTTTVTRNKAIASYDPNLNATQVINAASSSSISGSSVSFPSGSLEIPTAIVVEPSSNLADSSIISEVGLSSTAQVQSTAPGLVIRPNQETKVEKPFSLQIPIPVLATLTLTNNYDNLVVLYKKWDSTGSKLVSGIIPASKLTIGSGFVKFSTLAFGAYQAAILNTKVEAEVEAQSSEPIRNEENVTVVADSGVVDEATVEQVTQVEKVTISSISLSAVSSTRSVTVTATPSKTDVSGCYAEFRSDKTVPEGKATASLSSGVISATYKASNISAHSLYARINCNDAENRLVTSEWSVAASVSEASSVITFNEADRTADFKLTSGISGSSCYAYFADNKSFTNPSSKALSTSTADASISISSDAAFDAYGRIGCLDDSLVRRYTTLKGLTVLEKSLGVSFISGLATTLLSEDSLTLQVEGGTAPYTFTLTSGLGTITGDTYTAPTGEATTANIRVTDANGLVADHSVAVTIKPLEVLSPVTEMAINQTQQLNIVGGVPPYTVSVLDEWNYQSYYITVDANYLLSSGMYGSMNNTVTITDSASASTSFGLNTYGAPYMSGPTSTRVGFSIDLTVSGGMPPYSVVISAGGGSLVKISETLYEFTAPSTAQTSNIMVTESFGSSYEFSVTSLGSGSIDPSFGSMGYGSFNVPNGTGSGSHLKNLQVDSMNRFVAGGWVARCCTTSYWDYIGAARLTELGAIDNSYGSGANGGESTAIGTTVSQGLASVVLQDDSVVVVGYGKVAVDEDVIAVKYDASGILDTSFGTNGIFSFNKSGNDRGIAATVINESGAEFIIIALKDGTGGLSLIRISSNGVIDPAYGSAGIGNENVTDMSVINKLATTPTGIVAIGKSSTGQAMVKARNNFGGTDSSFNGGSPFTTGSATEFFDMATDGTDYYFSGSSLLTGVDTKWAVVKMNTATFTEGWAFYQDLGVGTDIARSIVVDGTYVYLLGSVSEDQTISPAGYTKLVRVDTIDGFMDTSFGAAGYVTIQPTTSRSWWSNGLTIHTDSLGNKRIIGLLEGFNSNNAKLVAIIP